MNNKTNKIKIITILFIVLSIFYIVQVRNFYGIIKTEIVQKQEIEDLKRIIVEEINDKQTNAEDK